MEDTAITLRAELERTRPARASNGFPPELRTRVGRWVLERQVAGDTSTALARQLGISAHSARAWARAVQDSRPGRSGGFLPVEVTKVSSLDRGLDGPVVHTPGGYRVSGLYIEEIITVLRGLE